MVFKAQLPYKTKISKIPNLTFHNRRSLRCQRDVEGELAQQFTDFA